AIDVEAGATLSAREIASGTSSITAHATDDSTGDSGSIRLDAPTIELASGSSLLAFVEDASRFSAGNISLTADQTGSEDDFGVASVTSSINLTDSIIKGGDVSLVANADLTANFGSDESFVGGVLDIIGLSVLGGVVRPEADAVITVDGGTVEADDLTLDADANVSSVVTVFTVFAAFAVAERSDPTADIQVTGNANIDASGDVVIDSDATSTLSVSATRFKPSGVGLYTEKVNVAVAYAKSEVTSKAIVDAGTSIVAGGAVSLTAHGEKSLDIKAITNTGRKGVFATSLTVSLDTNLVEAKLDGDVAAGGDIDVIADFKSEVNENQAFSVVGATGLNNLVKDTATVITRPSAILSAASQGGIKGGLKSIFKKSREDFTAKFGFTAGWAWSDHDNTVTARIGPGAIVESTNGSIEVSATSSDLPEISGSAYTISDPGAQNVRENAIAAAVSVGQYTNNAYAYIGAGAQVTAASDLLVESRTEIPWEQKWDKWRGLKTITSKLNLNFGIQDGFFTSWAEAYSIGSERAFGGNINLLSLDGESQAYIGENAVVDVGGDTSIIATNENDSVNFSGQFLFGQLGIGTVAGGSGVGGSIVVVDQEATNQATIKDGAVVDTGSLLVLARSDERSIALASQAAKADDFSFGGAAIAMLIDNITRASIDDGAQITTGNAAVKVPRDFDTYSAADTSVFSDVPQFFPLEDLSDDGDDDPILRVDVEAETISLAYDHGLTDGQAVMYFHGTDGVDIGGLLDRSRYYAVVVDESTLQLKEDPSDVSVIDFDLDDTEGRSHTLFPGIDPSASGVITDSSGKINVGYEHDLVDGQTITYFNLEDGRTSVDDIPGLTHATRYVVDVVDDTTFKLIAEADRDEYFAAETPDQDLVISISTPTDDIGVSHFLVPLTGATGASDDEEIPSISLPNDLASLDSNNDGSVNSGDDHIVSIDGGVYTTDLSLLVLADDTAGLYAGAGAISLGRNIGVGVAVSLKDIVRTTEALVGNGLGIKLTPEGVSGPGVGIDSEGEIYLGYDHGFSDGDVVTYSSGGDFTIDGLYDGDTYFVNLVSDSDSSGDPTIKLARTALEASESSTTNFEAADIADAQGMEIIDLGYAHGFQLGDPVIYHQGTGDAVGGLVDGTIYYAFPTGTTTLALTEFPEVGRLTFDTVFDPDATVDDDTIIFNYEHEFIANQAVRYTAGGGEAFGDLTDGATYFIESVDEVSLQLKDSDGNVVSLGDAADSVGHAHTLQPGVVLSDANVDSTTRTIDLGFYHGFNNGDPIIYRAADGTPLSGLTDGEVYYVVVDGEETIALAETEDDADVGKWRFFESEEDISDSIINLNEVHEYSTDDELIYTIAAYYADDATDTVAALQYVDPDTGETVTMTEGQSFYVIAVDGEANVVDLETGDTTTQSIAIQLALEPSGDALTLVTTNAAGVHGFRWADGRIGISVSNADESHYFQTYERIDLDASSSTGSDYTFRLSLDPSSSDRSTHGLGKVFDPSTAVTGGDTNKIDLGYTHGFTTGDAVVYSRGSLGDAEIGGLGHGNIYYVIVVDTTTIQLTETADEALLSDPEVIELDPDLAGGTNHGFGRTFRPEVVVDSQLSTIDFGRTHGFTTGDALVYDDGGGTAIGGLTDGTTYFVIDIDSTTIQLAETLGEATADTPTALPLDGTLSAGFEHAFTDPEGDGFVISGGDALVVANNSGEIISVSLAAATATEKRGGGIQSGQVTSYQAAVDRQNGENQPRFGVAIAGDISVNIIRDTTNAFVVGPSFQAESLEVAATNTTLIGSGSGAIAIANSTANSVGLAGSFNINVVSNSTQARIDDSTVTTTGDVTVGAETAGEIIAISVSGSSVNGILALAGSVSVNVISNDTVARISDGSDIDAGNVNVTANEEPSILAVAGAVSANFSGKQIAGAGDETPRSQLSIGASISVNVIGNTTGAAAFIEDSDVSAEDVNVTATSNASITSVGIAIAAAVGLYQDTKFAFAGAISVGVNVTNTRTRAYIKRKSSDGIDADGNVTINADNTSTIQSVAGAGAVAFTSSSSANSTGVGISLASNNIFTDVESYLSTTTVTADSVDLLATSDGTIQSLGVGGAGARNNAVGGQFTLNLTFQNVDSYIEDSTVTVSGTAGDIDLQSTNSSLTQSLAGGVALAGDGEAVGAALAISIIRDTVDSYVEGSDLDAIDGSVLVEADSTNRIDTIAVGFAAAAQTALAGSAVVALIVTDTLAYISDSSVDADRNVFVHADQDADLTTIGGAISFSSSASGIGGALSVGLITNNTRAYIEASEIFARANDSVTLTIPTWDDQANQSTETRSGLAVIASSTQGLELLSGSLSASGAAAGIGINLTPSFLFDTTYAYIDNSTVNESDDLGGDVIVRAHQDTDLATLVGAAGISSSASGIGLAAQGAFVSNDTQALITDSDLTDATGNGRAAIYSGGDVDVSTATREVKETVVVGLAAAATFAGAGSVDYTGFSNTNRAEIREVDVFAEGDLNVTASDTMTVFAAVGGISVGIASGAGGGTFAVVDNNNVTEALMTSAHTNANGATLVEAKSEVSVDTSAVMLGGSLSASFQGSFVFYNSTTDTRAIIEGGGSRAASVNADDGYDASGQSVTVYAQDDTTIEQLVGAASGSVTSAGVAGALTIQEIQNTVDAHIGSESFVSAVDSLTVQALSEKDLFAGAGGLSVAPLGISGTIALLSIGTGLSSDGSSEITTDATTAINNALASAFDGTGLTDRSPLAVRDQVDSTSVSVDPKGSSNRSTEDLAAFIDEGADVFVGADLTIDASEIIVVESGAGAAAVGGIAVGAAVTIVSIETDTDAYIAGASATGDSTITVGGALSVQASADESVDATSLAGAGGASFTLGVQYAGIDVGSDQNASIGDGAQVLLATGVDVLASHTRDFDANSTGGAVGFVAAGVSASDVTVGGTVKATIGEGVVLGEIDSGQVVGTVGSLDVVATSTVTQAKAVANAAAGGALAGGFGTISDVEINPTLNASIDGGSSIYADGTVTVTTQTESVGIRIVIGLGRHRDSAVCVDR
ncbi:MAG: hypothetical protein AAFU85_16550, partial [Planctomycetota bacterium]